MSFSSKVFIAMLLGAILGLVFPAAALQLTIIGALFIKGLKMIILPMILFCVTAGVAQMGNAKTVGKVGLGVLGLSAIVNFLAASAGVFTAILFDSAKGVTIPSLAKAAAVKAPTASEIILSVVPDNIFGALSSGNILAIVFFTMLLGVAIVMAGENGKPFMTFINSAADVVNKLISMIIKVTPYGVFCLLAETTAKHGAAVLGSLANFLLCVWVGTIGFVFLLCLVLCNLFAKVSFTKFLSSIKEAFMMAMATCSGAATMPLNVANTEKYFGVPTSFSTMIISIGTVITNGGSNVYKAAAVYFLATLYGVNIGLPQIFTIIVVTSFVVTAGVPAAGTLTAAIILNSLGAPIEGIALLMGVDRLRDMISTAGNVTVQSMASITLFNMMEKDVVSPTTTDISKGL